MPRRAVPRLHRRRMDSPRPLALPSCRHHRPSSLINNPRLVSLSGTIAHRSNAAQQPGEVHSPSGTTITRWDLTPMPAPPPVEYHLETSEPRWCFETLPEEPAQSLAPYYAPDAREQSFILTPLDS